MVVQFPLPTRVLPLFAAFRSGWKNAHFPRTFFFARVLSHYLHIAQTKPPGSDCLFSYFMLFPHPSPHLGGHTHGDWDKCVSPLTVLTSDRIGFIVTLFAHRTTSAIDAGCGNGWPCVWPIDSMRICGMQLAIQLPPPFSSCTTKAASTKRNGMTEKNGRERNICFLFTFMQSSNFSTIRTGVFDVV